MTKLKQILKCNKGQSFPLTIFIALVLVLIITGISEYYRLMIVAQGVRDSLQDAVISTVTENYADVYHSTREGYSAAYQPVAEDFEESLNYGDVYNRLENIHDLTYNSYSYEKLRDDGALEFKVYNLQVDIHNAPIRGGDIPTDRFEIDSYITLEVPVSFAGNLLPNMKITIKTTAGYTPIF